MQAVPRLSLRVLSMHASKWSGKSGQIVSTVVTAMCIRFPCGESDTFQTGNRCHRQPCVQVQRGRRQGVRKRLQHPCVQGFLPSGMNALLPPSPPGAVTTASHSGRAARKHDHLLLMLHTRLHLLCFCPLSAIYCTVPPCLLCAAVDCVRPRRSASIGRPRSTRIGRIAEITT